MLLLALLCLCDDHERKVFRIAVHLQPGPQKETYQAELPQLLYH